MPGSHAEEIVVDYFEAEPDLDLPPLPQPTPQPSALSETPPTLFG